MATGRAKECDRAIEKRKSSTYCGVRADGRTNLKADIRCIDGKARLRWRELRDSLPVTVLQEAGRRSGEREVNLRAGARPFQLGAEAHSCKDCK